MKRLVAVFLALALVAVPAVAAGTGPVPPAQTSDSETIDLVLRGTVATDVNFDAETTETVQRDVATQLDVDAQSVFAITSDGSTTIEVRTGGVSPQELGAALDAAGVAVDGQVRRGVSNTTAEEATRILQSRLETASGYNGTVERVDNHQVRLEVTPAPPEHVVERLVQPGEVQFFARTPDGTSAEIFSNDGVLLVRDMGARGGFPAFEVQLTGDGATSLASTLIDLNYTTQEGLDACEGNPAPDATGYCLVVALDGENLTASGVSEPLAQAAESGELEANRLFAFLTPDENATRDLRVAFSADPLPVPVERVAAVTTPTATPTPTPTPTATPTETPGADGPGFTLLLALVGLAAGLLALRDR